MDDDTDLSTEVLDPDIDDEAHTHVDCCTVCASCTPNEADEGQRLGLSIDTNNDRDAGFP